MSDTPSSSDRRRGIKASRILALVATVAGLLLSATGILLHSGKFEYGDAVALVGITLLAAGAFYGFALSRRSERVAARDVRFRKRAETREIEGIKVAHRQVADCA